MKDFHTAVRGAARLLSGWRMDAVVATRSVVLVTGVALDCRAHASGITFAEEGVRDLPMAKRRESSVT